MFTFESLARYSRNYLERLVDSSGLPYFNVFWTSPAQAAHDWPDFGDVMSRQLQGAIFLRRMTGQPVSTEQTWLNKILALLNPTDGLLYRPATTFSKYEADPGDAALTLYALVTAAIDRDDPHLRSAAMRMSAGILARLSDSSHPAWSNPFLVKSLMAAYRRLECQPALAAARLIIERAIFNGRLFTPDNTFGPSGHMHGNLRAMAGAIDFALAVGDPVLFSRMNALYQYVKTTGTRFGWLPEAIGRQSPIVPCETCALMDFAGVGVTLANHGHPEYWGDMERLARNHLAESQVHDLSFLQVDNQLPDTDQFTWEALDERLLGAWAGWSSPNHILAARETLNHHWGGPELRDKTRLLQNCCGGSGVHALFTLWKNSAQFTDGCLSVHMHLDKRLPQAEIRCQQPYQGLTTIQLFQDSAVKVRIPDFTQANDMPVSATTPDGVTRPVTPTAFGNYLELGSFAAGAQIALHYPLPVFTEEFQVGNPGYRPWRYRATWKGDTVVKVEPLDNEVATAYSDFDERAVPIFYGNAGPGPLYQRQHMLDSLTLPPASPLYLDDEDHSPAALNFWRL